VSEEETTGRVMRVTWSVCELVMRPMIPGPVVDGALVRKRIQKHEKYPKREFGNIGAVRPQSVGSAGDAKATNLPTKNHLKEQATGIWVGESLAEADNCQRMRYNEEGRAPFQQVLTEQGSRKELPNQQKQRDRCIPKKMRRDDEE